MLLRGNKSSGVTKRATVIVIIPSRKNYEGKRHKKGEQFLVRSSLNLVPTSNQKSCHWSSHDGQGAVTGR